MDTPRLLRIALVVYTAFTVGFFIYLPVAVIIVYSFNDVPFFIPEWRGFTLEWFVKAFTRRDVVTSLWNSLYIAVFTTAASLALAIPPTFYVVRGRGRVKDLYMLYLMLPFVIPWIIIGVSLYIFYWYLGIEKSLLTAALGHIVYSIPLIVTLLAPRLYSLDPDIERASMDLGATPWQTFRYVVFPQVFPAIVSAAIITFIWSFDNFVISYYTLGAELTWPVWVFSVIGKQRNIFPVVMAVSTMIILVSTVVIAYIVKKGYVDIL